MKQLTRDGFILILAMLTIALAAAAVLILARLAGALLFDANQAYLQAYNRNISASALAWAQHNGDRLAKVEAGERISLDVGGLNIPEGELRIGPLEPNKANPRIQIEIRCQQDRMKLMRSDDYLIGHR